MKTLMQDRNARWYLGGQVFSLFGDTALWLAMGIWVKELTGSTSEAGLTFFFFAFATILAPLAGLIVDRVRRRPVLIIANLAGAAIVLPLLVVHGRNLVWLIWLVMFLYGIVYCFLSSAQSALLVTMFREDQLVDANGLLRTVREGLRLVAPLSGAALFAVIGGGAVALLDGATFLLAAGSMLFVKVNEEPQAPREQHLFGEVSAGVVHLFRVLVLRQSTIAVALACLVVGFFESIDFAVIGEGLHHRPTFLGVVIAVQGLGAIAGGISSPRLIRRFGEGPVIGLGLAFLAGGAVLFLVANVWVVFAAAIVLGASLPWIIVAYNTQLQLRTPTNLQGRAFSASDTLTSVPQTVSIAVGAALLSIVDYRLLLVAVGAIVAIAACYQLSRREQWKRDSGEGPDQLSLLAFSAEAPIEPPVGEAVR